MPVVPKFVKLIQRCFAIAVNHFNHKLSISHCNCILSHYFCCSMQNVEFYFDKNIFSLDVFCFIYYKLPLFDETLQNFVFAFSSTTEQARQLSATCIAKLFGYKLQFTDNLQ